MLYRQPRPEEIVTQSGCAPERMLPRELTVCVWNWQKSKCAGWTEEFNALAGAADLFLAQEVRCSPLVKKQMEKTRLCWTHAAGFLSLKNKYPVGVATGACAAPEKIRFKQGAREPLLKIPKMMLAAAFALETGQTLLTVNVHAINFTGITPFQENMHHAAELLCGFKGPVILGGDFNAWNQKRRNLLGELVSAAHLTEVVFSPDTRTRCLGRKVDFLFTRGLKTLAAGVRCTDASDHNPLLARLILQ